MIPDCMEEVFGSPKCNLQKYCCSDAIRGIAVKLRVSTWHVELDLKGSLFKNVR